MQCLDRHITTFPEEVLIQIFTNLDQEKLARPNKVCTQWRRLTNEVRLPLLINRLQKINFTLYQSIRNRNVNREVTLQVCLFSERAENFDENLNNLSKKINHLSSKIDVLTKAYTYTLRANIALFFGSLYLNGSK